MPQFVITEQGEVRVEVVDKPVLFIGSHEDSDIRLQSDQVALLHCQIKRTGTEYRIVDLNTQVGTFVNGIAVQEHVLRHGDIIQLGDVSLVFHLAPSEVPATPEEGAPARQIHLQLEDDGEEDFSLDLEIESTPEDSHFFNIADLQWDQLRNFLNLNMPISTTPDLNILLDRIIDSVLDLTSSTSGMFLVYNERFQLTPRCQRNLAQQHLGKAIRYILKPVANRVVETNGIVSIPDIHKADFLNLHGFEFPEYQTVIGIPLRTIAKESGLLNQASAHLHPANRTLGVLLLIRHRGHESYSEAEIPMIEAVSHQVAVSIFNLKLHTMASTDPLTGLYGRNYFQANLSEELEFAKLKRYPLSVAILDVDYFKRFNEFYGARTADRILQSMGRLLLGHIRDIDIVARYGGEKFIFLFLHMPSQGAFEVMERIRKEIQSFPFLEGGYRVSVSCGIASYPEHGDSPEQLVERADQALYRAKKSGRNCTVVWDRQRDLTGERTDNLAGLVSGNLAKDYQNMQALMDTIRLRSQAADPQELIHLLLAKIMEVTHTERAMIFQNTDGELRYILAKDRLGQELYDEIMAPYSKKAVEQVLESRIPTHIVWHPKEEYPEGEDLDESYSRSILCAPLRDRSHDWGVLYVDSPDVEREVTEADVNFFDAFARQIALAFTQAQLHEELQDKERMEHEFGIAAQIQNDLLPSEFPYLEGIEIFGITKAAKEVGGDYYDVIATEEEYPRYFVCIGDVSGKGLPAGLVMIMARTALHSLISTGSVLSPADLLFHLNKMIYENTGQGVFMSMLIFEVLQDGIEYASAGHEHILVYRQAQQEVEAIRSGGVVLGLSPYIPPFENKFLPLAPGDFVLLYTDGATEAQNKEGEEFQLERLIDYCQKYGSQGLTPQEVVQHTLEDILQFFRGAEQHDDITLLITKRTQ